MALVEVTDGLWLNPDLVAAVRQSPYPERCQVYLPETTLTVKCSAEACIEALTGGPAEPPPDWNGAIVPC